MSLRTGLTAFGWSVFSLAVSGCAADVGEGYDEENLAGVQEAVTVGTAVNCPNGTANACTVRNMPMLLQTSNQLDTDVTAHGPGGCYDASITSVAVAALANRSTGRALVDRSRTFNNITAGNNGATPPVTTTKAYEQLSQVYRWADAPDNVFQPFHFPEIVADIIQGTTGTARRFPAGCNPNTYGSCSWYTGTYAPDTVAAGFRDFTANTSHVTNAYFKGLMNQGFAPMLAYIRYVPVRRANGSRWDMTFTRVTPAGADLHKVAVSGYQPGAFPTRVNDVGHGRAMDVNITNDVNAIPSWDGVAPQNVVNWYFPNGLSRQSFVYYNPAQLANQPIMFLELVDALSLGLPSSGPIRQVFDGGWGAWTTLMPFKMNGLPHQLAYNSSTGAVHFDRFYANANGAETLWSYTWGSGFSHFAPYYIGGNPYFIAYNAATGAVHFDQFPSNLQGPIIHAVGTWPAGVTSITPFAWGSNNYMLLYNKNTGAVRYERMNADGKGSTTMWSGTWGTGWTDFAAYDIGGTPHLVAYNSSNGTTHYDRVPTNFSGVQILAVGSLPTGLKLSTLDHVGPPTFVGHKTSSGATSIYRVAMDGTSAAEAWASTTIPNVTSIVPFTQSEKNYVMLYSLSNGDIRSYELTLF